MFCLVESLLIFNKCNLCNIIILFAFEIKVCQSFGLKLFDVGMLNLNFSIIDVHFVIFE